MSRPHIDTIMTTYRLGLVLSIAAAVLVPGCVVYETAPGQYSYTRTDNYDRAWSAALGAMQDTGVQIVSSDPGSGTVRGSRNGAEVTVSVTRQADGTTRVAFNTRAAEREPDLAQRLSAAYERRMGR